MSSRTSASSSSTSSSNSGRACIAKWISHLKQLEDLASASEAMVDSADADRLSPAGLEVLMNECTPTPASPQIWEQLVLQLKMPLRLGTACSKLAQHQPQSLAMQAAAWRLHEFLAEMPKSGSASSSTGHPPRLLAAVAQQLEQSGLLDHLPDLLTVAAEGLTEQTAGRPAQPAQHAMRGPQWHQHMYKDNLMQMAIALSDVALQTVLGCPDTFMAAPSSTARYVAVFVPALMHLTTAVMQYASTHVQDLEAATWAQLSTTEYATAAAVRSVVMCTFASTITVLGGYSGRGADFTPAGLIRLAEKVPAVGKLLQSRHMLPWCALICAVMGTWWLTTSQPETQQDVQQAGQAASGSSATSNTAQSGPAASRSSRSRTTRSRQSNSQPQPQPQQQQAPATTSDLPSLLQHNALARLMHDSWQQACRMLPHAVPPSCAELFQLLSVDSRVVAWAGLITAEALVPQNALAEMMFLYASTRRVRSKWAAYAATSQQGVAGFQEQQKQHSGRMQALLCTLLLCLAACVPLSHPHCNILCLAATLGTHDALNGFNDAFLQIGTFSQEVAVGAWLQQRGPPAIWLEAVLPLMAPVCNKLLSQLQHTCLSEQDLVSTSGAVSGAGSGIATEGRVSSRLSSQALLAVLPQAVVADVCEALKHSMRTLCGLFALFACVDSNSRLRSSTTSSTEHRAAQSAIHAAADASGPTTCFITAARSHGSEIYTLLDGIVRTVAAKHQAAGASTSGMVEEAVAGMMMQAMLNVALLTAGPLAYVPLCFAPGSKERQQLHSLLFSLTKLSNAAAAANNAVFGSLHATRAAAAVLSGSLRVEAALATGSSSGSRPPGTACGQLDWFHQSVVPGIGLTEAEAVPDQSLCRLQSTASVLSAVPSLALLGCCCLQCADRLMKEMPDILQQPADLRRSNMNDDTSLSCFAVGYFCLAGSGRRTTELHIVIAVFQRWLQHPSVSAQLAAVGYKPDDLLQQLADLLTARQAAADSLTADTLTALVEQLQATGMAFSSLAHPVACNNTECSNVSGPTELRLVSGKSCVCSGCRTARYCSRSCQKSAWKQHKPVCTALRAAAAAAGDGGGDEGGGVTANAAG